MTNFDFFITNKIRIREVSKKIRFLTLKLVFKYPVPTGRVPRTQQKNWVKKL
jgi:hypothetical protein